MMRRPARYSLFPYTSLCRSQLAAHLASRGRTVVPVALDGVLHLKSAVTALPDGTIVCADESVLDTSVFPTLDRKSTRLNSSHANISYAVFCLKKTIQNQ